jgi:replicative DNA helicase
MIPTTEIKTKLTAEATHIVEHRIHLEQCILGAVLLETPALVQVMDVLNEKTFSAERRTIWKAIIAVHEDGQPVDIITVTHSLIKHHPDQAKANEWALNVSRLTAHVNSAANIRTHAILLVELTITSAFVEIYTSCEMDNYAYAMANDILQALYTDADKLTTMEQAITWLNRTIPDHEITQKLNSLQSALLAKVSAIKRSERLRTTLLTLEQLVNDSPRIEVRELAETLIIAINKPKLPVEFTNQVFNLKKLLATA